MNVEVVAAAASEAKVLSNLMSLYVYEFSKVDPQAIGAIQDDGRFVDPSLDKYWSDSGRHPFLIRVDGRLAGFVLVAESKLVGLPTEGYAIAEFFVLQSYRRRRVGEDAARWLFDKFPGHWSVAEHAVNEPAQAFWRAVIGRYTRGRYEESRWGDQDAVFQTFDNSVKEMPDVR